MSRLFSFGAGAPWRRLSTRALLAVLALAALPAFAQTSAPAPDSSSSSSSPSSPSSSSPTDSTGSPDSGGAPDADAAGSSSSSGPSLLSRDFISALGVPQINLTPFVQISGVYDSGLDGVQVGSQSNSKGVASFGTQYSLGLSGVHTWQHSRITFNYQGATYRYFSSNSYKNSSQSLGLNYVRLLNRRAMLTVSESASSFTRGFSQPTISSSYVPALDVNGNHMSSFNTQIALMYQKSARLSFSVAGYGGLSHQTSVQVYDIGSVGFTADAQYRLSARASAGASYSYSDYIYPGSTSSTHHQNMNGQYSLALTRRTQIGISAGFMRSESQYLQLIPVLPVLAYLTGERAAVVIHHQVANLPSGSLRVSRKFNKSSASFSGGYTVIPGNGLFLATVATSFSANYSYSGLRRWGLSAGGSYSQGESIGTALGRYGTFGMNASASRPISRITQAMLSFSTTKYSSASVSYYNRLMYQISIGVGISPGRIPLGPR